MLRWGQTAELLAALTTRPCRRAAHVTRQHVWPTVGHVGGEVAADGLEVLHFLLLFLRRDVHRLKVHQLDQRAADVHSEPGEGCRAQQTTEGRDRRSENKTTTIKIIIIMNDNSKNPQPLRRCYGYETRLHHLLLHQSIFLFTSVPASLFTLCHWMSAAQCGWDLLALAAENRYWEVFSFVAPHRQSRDVCCRFL